MLDMSLLLFLAVASPERTDADGPLRPNIVVLYADDMGYGDLAVQNPAARIPTPNLDRLAGEGTRFTDAHSSSGICTPSRYALLTGQHHWRRFHEIVNSFGSSVIPPSRLTMAEMLRRRGYRTACIGKWHLGWDWRAIMRPDAEETVIDGRKAGYPADAFDWSRPIPDGPVDHGFDHYFGDDVPNFPPYAWIEDDRVIEAPTVPYKPDPMPAEGHPEGRPGPMVAGWKQDDIMPTLTRRAVQWIAAQRGSERPFFLYFPFTSPHAPIVPAAEFRGKTDAGGYGDFVLQTDWTVGRVLAAIDEHGFAENTIVIFTSDNGPEHYAFERSRRTGHRSFGPLRGLKRDVWEGGHRVPLLIRWPGEVAAGEVSDALVCQVDLMATLAHIVGFELPDDAAEDSFDLLPLLRREVASVRDFAIHNTYADKWAVRRGRWLLIDTESGSHTKVPQWFSAQEKYEEDSYPAALYDLREDLGQRTNLYASRPDEVEALRALLAHVRERGHSAPRLDHR